MNKLLVKFAIVSLMTFAFIPDVFAQISKPGNGDVYYYRRTDNNEYGCVFYAVKFMDGYIISASIMSSENTFSQFKKDGNIQGLKSYLLQELNNKTERMKFSETNTSGEPVYGDAFYSWTFTKDYSRFSSYDEEALYYGVNPIDVYSRIELRDIFKY